jgi:ActR/RegA family two-component response regulator
MDQRVSQIQGPEVSPNMRMPVLVVGVHEDERTARAEALVRAGFTTLPVASFLEARDVLTEIEPEALVTDVQLGDYNGLHLVAIAQVEHPRTTCVVVGPRDPALQSESYHLGARYLVEPIDAERVSAILAELVATPRPQRRWPRKRPVHQVPTFVSGIEARIVDVSYGGAGIEIFGDELPAETLQLTVPGTGIAVPVERVWARRTAKAQPMVCGLALRRDSAVDAQWRSFVDALELLPGILPSPNRNLGVPS